MIYTNDNSYRKPYYSICIGKNLSKQYYDGGDMYITNYHTIIMMIYSRNNRIVLNPLFPINNNILKVINKYLPIGWRVMQKKGKPFLQKFRVNAFAGLSSNSITIIQSVELFSGIEILNGEITNNPVETKSNEPELENLIYNYAKNTTSSFFSNRIGAPIYPITINPLWTDDDGIGLVGIVKKGFSPPELLITALDEFPPNDLDVRAHLIYKLKQQNAIATHLETKLINSGCTCNDISEAFFKTIIDFLTFYLIINTEKGESE